MNNVLNIKVVVGSWKAYNECNDRSLGSKWLDLADYDSIEEIYEELKNEGFTASELEETFIQDYESDVDLGIKCDYTNINELFEMLEKINNSDLDEDTLQALIEAVGYNEAIEYINNSYDDIYLYSGQDMLDVATELFDECYANNLPENLRFYIDYETFARDLKINGGYYETSKGILEIR